MKPTKLLRISLLVALATSVAKYSCSIITGAFSSPLFSQSSSPPQQGMGGASARAARVYQSRRTVGIVDPRAPAIFEDISARTTLALFKHRSGGAAKDYILEASSGGVAVSFRGAG